MKVDVSDILAYDGKDKLIELDEIVGGLDTISVDYVFEKVSIKAKLARAGDLINFDGRLRVDYSVKCARCLKEFSNKLDIELSEEFRDAVKCDDKEVYAYERKMINLDRFIIENVVLNLPISQVCSEDCKGLCQECGCNLNKVKCDCKVELEDSRLQLLKTFFTDDN